MAKRSSAPDSSHWGLNFPRTSTLKQLLISCWMCNQIINATIAVSGYSLFALSDLSMFPRSRNFALPSAAPTSAAPVPPSKPSTRSLSAGRYPTTIQHSTSRTRIKSLVRRERWCQSVVSSSDLLLQLRRRKFGKVQHLQGKLLLSSFGVT